MKDLGPLAGSSLKTCVAGNTPITSLRPLSDTPVNNLWFNKTVVNDISFMQGMSLTNIHCHYTPLQNLDYMKGQPLMALDCYESLVRGIEPLAGMTTLITLNITNTRVVNLKPLLTLSNLKFLWCDFDWDKDGEIIFNLPQLERINNFPRQKPSNNETINRESFIFLNHANSQVNFNNMNLWRVTLQ